MNGYPPYSNTRAGEPCLIGAMAQDVNWGHGWMWFGHGPIALRWGWTFGRYGLSTNLDLLTYSSCGVLRDRGLRSERLLASHGTGR